MLRSFCLLALPENKPINASFKLFSTAFIDKNLYNSKNDYKVDVFTQHFLNSRIEISPIQEVLLRLGSSLGSLFDPYRHDLIACLGETTGHQILETTLKKMKQDCEGKQILKSKPRINTKTIDIEYLRSLSINTFGHLYTKFLDENNVTPDSRMEVKFINDPELAYVITRYRECHDLIHTILGMPTHMLGEVAVKWVEALNVGLPMCYGGAIFGALRLQPKQRKLYTSQYLPWAIANGTKTKPLISVYWEKRWEQDIKDLRRELNITKLK